MTAVSLWYNNGMRIYPPKNLGGFDMGTKDYDEIKLEAVENLMSYSFFIPDYQRGYRWKKEQVEELLTDLWEFHEKIIKDQAPSEIYCLQPLVIQKKDDGKWHVIDGQQRLTTLYILLSCLRNPKLYNMEYGTRKGSETFLPNINQPTGVEDYKTNADYYHMYWAKETINDWLMKDVNRRLMLSTINHRVCFVLYKLKKEEDPIKVFQRLNIGKIALTESELVKALFFNSDNFPTEEQNKKDKLLSFVEMANEWDQMEYRLQDDRFWLFFHGPEYNKPTRIDFILDICRKMDHDVDQSKYEEKSHPSFSYYYDKFKNASDKRVQVTALWKKITECFKIIEEWYHDEELYHYIGFLSIFDIDARIPFEDNFVKFIEAYQKDDKGKAHFLKEQKEKIRKKCGECLDLGYVYEEPILKKAGTPKTRVRPLLLLHNIQTIIDQNESIREEKKYGLPDFVRFPFHLYKKENWDVEHIRPNQSQDFEGERKSSVRRKFVFILEEDRKKRKKAGAQGDAVDQLILNYTDAYRKTCTSSGNQLLEAKKEEEKCFMQLWEEVNKATNDELKDSQKNKVWNYVLLDASTNREYGNSCYSVKREYVMSKEKGLKPVIEIDNKTGECFMKPPVSETAFVPVCTSLVFSKSYSAYPENLRYWTQEDATYYRMDLEKTLWWYLKERIEKSLKIKPELSKKQYMAMFEKYKEYVTGDFKNCETTMYDYCTDPQNIQTIKNILGV